jgi:CubicO group peptidase (beta-lactamase class C family)
MGALRHGAAVEHERPVQVDLSNWDLGGAPSEWAYRHADRVFKTAALFPGHAPRPLPRFDDHRLADVPLDTSAGTTRLRDHLHTGRVSALTILSGGRVSYRWDDGSSRRHLLMSVSKVVASLAVGLLEAADNLAYESSVRDYLPELSEQWNPCTVGDVLDMASGVQCPEVGDPGAYLDPSHPFHQFEASLGWRDTGGEHLSPYELVTSFARLGEPGTQYEYTSVNTFLLSWLVERVSGLSYAEALQRLIWDHMAFDTAAAICVNDSGVAVAHGGLLMTADDLARLGALWTPTSATVGHELQLPHAFISMLLQPRPRLRPMGEAWPSGAHPAGQWNLVYPDGDMFKSGFGGQGLYVSPARDVVIAFLGVPDEHGRTNELGQLCRQIARQAARPESVRDS